jgi:hypothetical protein
MAEQNPLPVIAEAERSPLVERLLAQVERLLEEKLPGERRRFRASRETLHFRPHSREMLIIGHPGQNQHGAGKTRFPASFIFSRLRA